MPSAFKINNNFKFWKSHKKAEHHANGIPVSILCLGYQHFVEWYRHSALWYKHVDVTLMSKAWHLYEFTRFSNSECDFNLLRTNWLHFRPGRHAPHIPFQRWSHWRTGLRIQKGRCQMDRWAEHCRRTDTGRHLPKRPCSAEPGWLQQRVWNAHCPVWESKEAPWRGGGWNPWQEFPPQIHRALPFAPGRTQGRHHGIRCPPLARHGGIRDDLQQGWHPLHHEVRNGNHGLRKLRTADTSVVRSFLI